MISWLSAIHPVHAALIGGIFNWGATALGATFIFFFRGLNRKILDISLGFAAGVMIAASFWSLLAPAIEISENLHYISWLWPLIGFLFGGIFLYSLDLVLPRLYNRINKIDKNDKKSTFNRNILLVTAITIHNIPEGLAVGVAFGATAFFPEATIVAAMALTVGIGIQNIPEGFAVAMPLLENKKMSKAKAFFWGQASGFVEVIGAIVGALLVFQTQAILPFALGFAAGAMIFVVVEEVIPQSQRAGNNHLATGGAMMGFAIMMLLDVALG